MERNLGAGAFKKRLRNKKPEPHADMAGAPARHAGPAGHIGFTQLGQDLLREARPVVAHLHRDRIRIETRGDQDLGGCEVDRVLHEGCEGVQDLGHATDVRLLHALGPGDDGLDPDVLHAHVRFNHLLHQLA